MCKPWTMPAKSRPFPSPDAGSAGEACATNAIDVAKVERVRTAMHSREALAAVAETFKVLGDPTRAAIAWALAEEELCVCDLAALLGKSQSAISHSLRALRELRLVRHRREGRRVCYSLDDEHIGRILRDAFEHVGESIP